MTLHNRRTIIMKYPRELEDKVKEIKGGHGMDSTVRD